MSVRIEETSFSGARIVLMWPAGYGIKATLLLTDPDGQTQTDTVEWSTPTEVPILDVVRTFAASIEALPHWRAREVLGEFRYGTADSDYSGVITWEVTEP
jgi:hypothetical protein